MISNIYYAIEDRVRTCNKYTLDDIYKDMALLGYKRAGNRRFKPFYGKEEIKGIEFCGSSDKLYKHVIVTCDYIMNSCIVNTYIDKSGVVHNGGSSKNLGNGNNMYYTYTLLRDLDKTASVKIKDLKELANKYIGPKDKVYDRIDLNGGQYGCNIYMGNCKVHFMCSYEMDGYRIDCIVDMNAGADRVAEFKRFRCMGLTKLGLETLEGVINYYERFNRLNSVLR